MNGRSGFVGVRVVGGYLSLTPHQMSTEDRHRYSILMLHLYDVEVLRTKDPVIMVRNILTSLAKNGFRARWTDDAKAAWRNIRLGLAHRTTIVRVEA